MSYYSVVIKCCSDDDYLCIDSRTFIIDSIDYDLRYAFNRDNLLKSICYQLYGRDVRDTFVLKFLDSYCVAKYLDLVFVGGKQLIDLSIKGSQSDYYLANIDGSQHTASLFDVLDLSFDAPIDVSKIYDSKNTYLSWSECVSYYIICGNLYFTMENVYE